MVRQEIEIISTIQNELEASDIASGRGTTGLSSKTVKNYIDRLYKTHQVNGGWNDLIEWVEEKYPSKNTQTSFFSAYLGASKHSPTFKKLIASQADEIRTTQMNLVKARTATQETHTIKKVVSYDELMELLPKLTGQEQLMLSLYTLMPPKRGDFGKVKLLKHPEVKDTEEANFLDVDNYELTIRDHKTRATFQFIKEKLPVEIRKYLRKSLKETPRRWLFTQENGDPYKDTNAFTKWVRATLAPHFTGRVVGIDALRHAYITEFHQGSKTYAESKELATSMGHSHAENQRYRQEG
jgi:hypothetical protein|tara:strand:+ start:2479 stop:3366 length:888 start_codon:yes stop_codon:yes gene_type:complete